MAIQCLKHIEAFHRRDCNYVCDICRTGFKYKHDAKLHHKEVHGSDKAVLDKMIGNWYKSNVPGRDRECYTRVINIDYEFGRVKLFRFDLSRKPRIFDYTDVSVWLDMCTIYISLGDFKFAYICGGLWSETDKMTVCCALGEAVDRLYDRLSIEGDKNGN